MPISGCTLTCNNTLIGHSSNSNLIVGTDTYPSQNSAIIAGTNNCQSGIDESFIAGGCLNKQIVLNGIEGGSIRKSVILAGSCNTQCSFCSIDEYQVDNAIVGGFKNLQIGFNGGSLIAAGFMNCQSGTSYSFMGGGCCNMMSGSVNQSAIIGGVRNRLVTVDNSFILGSCITGTCSNTTYVNNLCIWNGGRIDGAINVVTTGQTGSLIRISGCTNSNNSTVIGDCSLNLNLISNSTDSIIAGGCCNIICCSTGAAILGGRCSSGSSSSFYFIGGGSFNENSISSNSFIGAGRCNLNCLSNNSAVMGGFGNLNYISPCSVVGGGCSSQNVSSCYSVVGGGFNNINNSSSFSSVVGGQGNLLCASSTHSFVGGGIGNILNCSIFSSILGGAYNLLSGTSNSFAIGSNITGFCSDTTYINNLCVWNNGRIDGAINIVTTGQTGSFVTTISISGCTRSNNSTVLGNCSINSNTISTDSCRSVILGGLCNSIACCSTHSLIGVGCCNKQNSSISSAIIAGRLSCQDFSCFSFIGAGCCSCQYLSHLSAIDGGCCNIQFVGTCSFIGGGGFNCQFCTFSASIVGGYANEQQCSTSPFIGGGSLNCVYTADYSSILGGYSNIVNQASYSLVVGGNGNTIDNSWCSSIVGGYSNCISFSDYSSIVGGICNKNNDSRCSFIAGGQLNVLCCANDSFILGSNVTGCQSNTIYLNKEANYSETITLTGTCTFALVGPFEANMLNPSGASLYDIKVVGSYYSGGAGSVAPFPRSSYQFKQWSQAVVENNVFNGTGCVVINNGLLYSCFNSDATCFPVGAVGACATLTGSGNGVSGVFLYLKNRANAAGTGYCTVFTVNVSRMDS